MVWLEVVGWLGSVLVVLSLMLAGVWRFRVLNLIGAVIATGYNAVLGIWPFAAMNGAIAVIDVLWLIRLHRDRHDEAAYQVIEVAPDDAYLAHTLRTHGADIARFYPSFAGVETSGRHAFLVLKGDETVGVVLVRDGGGGDAHIELDYVTPRFRDFTPGEFVYRRSGVFARRGFRRLVVPRDVVGSQDYYERVGFTATDDAWVRDVEDAPVG
jgi:hypothetical protein